MNMGRRTRKAATLSAAAAAVLGLTALTGPGPAQADEVVGISQVGSWSQGDTRGSTSTTPMSTYVYVRGSHRVTAIRGVNDDSLWFSVDQGPYHQLSGTHTGTAAALTYFNNHVYLMHVGTTGDLFWTTMDVSGEPDSWYFVNSWNRINHPAETTFRTSLRPTIGSSGNRLWIGAVGNNEQMYLNVMDTSNHLGSWGLMGGNGRTQTGITLTTTPANEIYIAHRGTNSQIYYNVYNFATGRWLNNNEWVRTGYETQHAPSLTYDGVTGRVALAFTNNSRRPIVVALTGPANGFTAINDNPAAPLTDSGPNITQGPYNGTTGEELELEVRWENTAPSNWVNHIVHYGVGHLK